MRWKRLLVFALAIAAIITGCGGDDSEGDESLSISTSSISKDEFVEQANTICKPTKGKLLKAVVAYQSKHLNEASEKVVPDAARKVIRPEVETQIEEIRSIGAPEGDAEKIEKFFASLDKGIDEIIKKKPTTFDEAEGLLLLASEEAKQYGLDQCKYVLVDQKFNSRILNE